MYQSFGYILNRRPFRDTSLLLDIFTEDFGRICCVARPAKKRGKVVKGNTEPFRYLHLQWIGKGDVQTLVEADERGRHQIPPSELMMGLYLNELLLMLTQQHVSQSELFSAYKYTLHKLGDTQINRQILMRFEVYLLHILGFPVDNAELSQDVIDQNMKYQFTSEEGLTEIDMNHPVSSQTPIIDAKLLHAIQDMQSMDVECWTELRPFLDKVFSNLTPRVINTRKLLNL
ncbi:DNA repair protein RecO [uncultured Cocleimonas sp.]|uniref:DNA repair protein RecO n=1 Tax=uncultured Cocleimonas sp. TaxID=1051587 RepID=UPI0026021E7C|nr:DNA repair protein RecO [uncultured Cocleimonas sp.]